MDQKFDITIDAETDWGGRSESFRESEKGLDIILKRLFHFKVKALIFFSTEVLEDFTSSRTRMTTLFERAVKDGHAIGSHGHFHHKYSNNQRLVEDRRLSNSILEGYGFSDVPYRAPKFDKRTWGWCEPYSNPSNHVSLLKMLWLRQKLNDNTIFYIHPFDVVGGINPPNLFCRLWYSKPRKALLLLEDVLSKYKGVHRLP